MSVEYYMLSNGILSKGTVAFELIFIFLVVQCISVGVSFAFYFKKNTAAPLLCFILGGLFCMFISSVPQLYSSGIDGFAFLFKYSFFWLGCFAFSFVFSCSSFWLTRKIQMGYKYGL